MSSDDVGVSTRDSRGPEACSLRDLAVGCAGCVIAVTGDRELRRRLLEMGLCNGARVECVRRAPFGDPIEYRVRGYNLSLRGEQALCVSIHPQGTNQST